MFSLFSFLAYAIGFYLFPGWQTIRHLKFKLPFGVKSLLSLAVGMSQLVLVAYFGRWLGAWWLVWGLVGWGLVGVKDFLKGVRFAGRTKINWPVVVLILAAVGFQMLVMVKSGTEYQGGLAFWGVHGHDGIWHLALMQELAQYFPPQNPGFAGVELQNYHYFFDLLGAEIYRVAGVGLIDLYFRYLPFLLALTANGLIYRLGLSLSNRQSGGGWAVFWFSFGSSLGFVLPWFGKGSANWETAFWAMQPATGLQNPPFYFSLVLLLATLIILLERKKSQRKRIYLWLPATLIGTIAVVKVYGWLVILAGLGWLGFWQIIKYREKYYFQLFSASLIVGGLFYFLTSGGGAGFVKWNPGWFLKVMLEAPDRVNWSIMEVRRANWAGAGRWGRVAAVWVLGLGLFVVGNLGTRLAACLGKDSHKKSLVEKLLWAIAVFGFLPPMLFTQEYVAWNTIQFFYYSIFAMGLLAAVGWSRWTAKIKNRKLVVVMGIGLIILSVPGSLRTVSWHLGEVPATHVSAKELEAFDYIKRETPAEAVILVYPYEQDWEEKLVAPAPLAYYNTAYVSFFANRRVYLEDETAALIQGYDYVERRNLAKGFFLTDNIQHASDFLLKSEIDYVYLVGDQVWEADIKEKVRPVFVNQDVEIWSVVH